MTTLYNIIIGVLIALVLIATASAFYAWYRKPPATNTVEYVKVPEIKEVIKIKKVEVPGPERIVTIEKQTIVEKLKLPEWFRTDENQQAIATAVIDPYKGKTNAVAILNTKTGVGQIIAKQEPLPLFGFVNDREIGIRAGINIKGEPVTSIYGQWDFVRVGSVHVGAYADADSVGQAKAQVKIGWKF